MKYLLILLAVVLLAAIGLLALSFISARVPDGLGVTNGGLADCPDRDNCVASEASVPGKRVPPIPATGTEGEVMDRLAEAVQRLGGEVAERRGGYLRAVFTSRLWRFRDDLECLYRPGKGVIEVRSAARVGYSDLGVNRRRVEDLRTFFTSP
ncbi:DUF1499 domain-containing protein [Pseudodesulfovibrio indicus]|uniref:DUF1499 domain-containing protein n=1 Tax=Pseudodesulfovibrio indicus TaxID=1716143 RepID=UPI00292DD8E6|nr:DUF1499 domain-containing protein [Pseudodesulfovibrio indicus]